VLRRACVSMAMRCEHCMCFLLHFRDQNELIKGAHATYRYAPDAQPTTPQAPTTTATPAASIITVAAVTATHDIPPVALSNTTTSNGRAIRVHRDQITGRDRDRAIDSWPNDVAADWLRARVCDSVCTPWSMREQATQQRGIVGVSCSACNCNGIMWTYSIVCERSHPHRADDACDTTSQWRRAVQL
jgi:hypothetical protein